MTEDISRQDVQELAGRATIAPFFRKLGFDDSAYATQVPAALGIENQALRDAIGYAARLAVLQDETYRLEVYLFELNTPSVTKAIQEELFHIFLKRAWDQLLVLTTDYEQLDFLLVERGETEAGMMQPEIEEEQRYRVGRPKPRSQPVDRRNPGDVALRVLRLLRRQAGEDVIDYCERLRSVYDLAYWSEAYFHNRALFSDYYLKERLPAACAGWGQPDTAESVALTRALQAVEDLYGDAAQSYASTAAQALQDGLIQPVLKLLGFAAEAAPRAKREKGDDKQRTADYTLYLTDRRGQRVGEPVCLCLAYGWGRDLDRKAPITSDYDVEHDPERRLENPGAVVVALLDAGQANWAIVTNGKLWRLYSARAHSRATNYYEIDLEEIGTKRISDPLEAFRYFWFLFRAEAFRPIISLDSGRATISLLDRVIRQSEQYAHELGSKLKDRVFEDIFPHFAQGFRVYANDHGLYPQPLEQLSEQERAARLQAVFDGTLTFLYRLLVLLYAESRGLLPVYSKSGSYYEYSLEQLKTTIATGAGLSEDATEWNIRKKFSDSSTEFYDRLQTLFRSVDKGNAVLNLPPYNGGLFITDPAPEDTSEEAAVARFLQSHKIPDRYLALGLDRMARVEDEKEPIMVFVDYKSLGVRQLGSIYEGLLEFKLHLAIEDMAVVPLAKGKKTELIIPWEEAKSRGIAPIKVRRSGMVEEKIYKPGEVYLINDRRERKATGSYYTPDYIVEYIVKHTVGDALEQKFAALREGFRQAQRQLASNQQREKAMHQLLKNQPVPEIEKAEFKTYSAYKDTLNEHFFDLKVLDPAMGSGHFLVEAVDYITDRMVHYLQGFNWNPVIYHLSVMRADILREMEARGIEIDAGQLTDINLLKRQVLKRCIYGVDINPMAVELAKVSVWLDSFTIGAPFSFLDHHLRCGNSLLGVRIGDARKDVEDTTNIQDTLFSEGSSLWASAALATGAALEVARLSDATAGQVLISREKHQAAERALAPYKRLLDIYLSRWFSNPPTKNRKTQAVYDKVIYFLRSKDAERWYTHMEPHYLASLTAEEQQIVRDAQHDAEERRFFHWEMEFPEVYFGVVEGTERVITMKKDAGFDVVIGNPPYVRQEGLGGDKVAFQQLYSIYNSIADLYTYFIERSHMLLHPGGHFGMITANKFMRANYGASLRSYLTAQVRLEKLIDFGDLPVFGEATTYPIILLSANAPRNGSPIEYTVVRSLDFADLGTLVATAASRLPDSAFSGNSWSLSSSSDQAILDKIRACSVPLGEYTTDGQIEYGVKTGLNEAFVIDRTTRDRLVEKDLKSAEIIKPFLVGEDVKRYDINFKERYLIFTRRGIDISKYKAVEQYLSQYRTRLEPRPAKWGERIKGEWPGRKPGSYKWYEIQDNVAYYADFEKPKIVYPNICMQPEFALDRNGYYSNQKTFIISIADLYLLAVLNSGVTKFLFNIIMPKLRGGFFEPGHVFMKDLPIRHIAFGTPEQERKRGAVDLEDRYTQSVQNVIEGGQDGHLAERQREEILALVEACLAHEPEQADVVHDLLAFLAGEMLRLNAEKRDAEQQFFSALARMLGIRPDKDGRVGIDSLKGEKDKRISDFAGDYQRGREMMRGDDVIRILKKNNGRFRSFDEAAILSLHKKSAAIIGPLTEKLKWTDELIDEIVYRLYGLTPEEQAIVEQA